MLEEILKALAHQICVRNAYPEKYDLVITNDLELEQQIVIKGGETPVIYVNRFWMINLMLEAEKKHSDSSKKLAMYPLKDALTRALKKAPRMTRSLALLTVKEAVELRKGAKKWAETLVPELKTHLRDRFFEIKYEIKVSVSETITGASISRNITTLEDVERTISESKSALARSIIESEEMSVLRDNADRIEDSKDVPVIPSSITIEVKGNNISERLEY